MLERMQKANGATNNVERRTMPQNGSVNLMRMSLLAHDRWQRNIAADRAPGTYAAKVICNRPASLKNKCSDNGGVTHDHLWFDTSDPGVSSTLFRVDDNPRIVAGGPTSSVILKCQLKPVQPSDYTALSSCAEWARFAIFPHGVCE